MTTKTLSFKVSIDIEKKNEMEVSDLINKLIGLGCVFEDNTILVNRERKCKDGSYWINPPVFVGSSTPIYNQLKDINGNFQ